MKLVIICAGELRSGAVFLVRDFGDFRVMSVRPRRFFLRECLSIHTYVFYEICLGCALGRTLVCPWGALG